MDINTNNNNIAHNAEQYTPMGTVLVKTKLDDSQFCI